MGYLQGNFTTGFLLFQKQMQIIEIGTNGRINLGIKGRFCRYLLFFSVETGEGGDPPPMAVAVGGALSFLVSGMTPRTVIFFFCFATIKTVDDHCGLWLLGNLFHVFFNNNSAYHDIDHQLYGNKYNFSQPFFVIWDKILGTHMPYSLVERKEGGFEARPIKKD